MAPTERATGEAAALVEALINECERIGRQQRMGTAHGGAIDTSAGERARDALLALFARYEAALDQISALPRRWDEAIWEGTQAQYDYRRGLDAAALIARAARAGETGGDEG